MKLPGLKPLNPRLPKPEQWQGQVVWIVGASSGIGWALASQLHAGGAQVWVSARSAGGLQDFVRQHPGAKALAVDVADAAALAKATGELLAQANRLDLVVACAGTYRPMRATEFDLAVASQHLAVNQGGVLNFLAAVLPSLLQQARQGQGGHISLVASVAGYRALPKALAYGPTKAALQHLAEALYLDLAPLGLGVSIVNPGFVATPLTAQNDFHMPALMQPDEAAKRILQGWAQGRFEIHFPRRFSFLLKALSCLPLRWYAFLWRKSHGRPER